MRYFIYILVLITLSSCGDVKHSIFDRHPESSERFSNVKNISKLQETSTPLKVAIISDTHQNYTDLEKVVDIINGMDVDFVLHLGDSTNSGYAMEYSLFLSFMKKLNKPYIVAIGNHDSIGYGSEIYESHFGGFNFSFIYKQHKFVIFNNNRFEFPSLDYDWAFSELDSSAYPVLFFNHINPEGDAFSPNEVVKNFQIVSHPKVVSMFNGHRHRFSMDYDTNDRLMLQAPRVEGVQFATILLENSQMTVKHCVGGCRDEADLVYSY